MSRWQSVSQRFLIVFVAGLLAVAAVAAGPPPNRGQDLGQAWAAKERHAAALLARPGVVGAAVGLTDGGQPAVLVLAESAGVVGLPSSLDGVPVVVHVTGRLAALHHDPIHTAGKPGGAGGIDPKSRFPRPVPTGISTGEAGTCSAGTIAARVKDAGGNVYALSNNHVYARENAAPLGTQVLQPGRYDTGCVFDSNNVIGVLSAFKPIVFSTPAHNTIDAAIARSSIADLGNATPSNGYGTPRSATVAAAINQGVQKYGRTTGLTTATVTGINATVNIGYSSGTAQFEDQIIIQKVRKWFGPGDSGSLVVTNPGRNPVGLFYAGNQPGTFGIANRIDLVLSELGVTIDGEP